MVFAHFGSQLTSDNSVPNLLKLSGLTHYPRTFLFPNLLLPSGHRFFILFRGEGEDLLSVFGALGSSSKDLTHPFIDAGDFAAHAHCPTVANVSRGGELTEQNKYV